MFYKVWLIYNLHKKNIVLNYLTWWWCKLNEIIIILYYKLVKLKLIDYLFTYNCSKNEKISKNTKQKKYCKIRVLPFK